MGQIKNNSKGISAVIAGVPIKPGDSLTVAFKDIPEHFITHPDFEVFDDKGNKVEKTKPTKSHSPRAGGARVGSTRTEPKKEKEEKHSDEDSKEEKTEDESPKKEDKD